MERKFTDDEIVKALEICSQNIVIRHNGLTYEGIPLRFLFEDALDLINRQKAENKRLADRNVELWGENRNAYNKDKSEAIKEFAERLKQYCAPGGDFGDPCGVLTVTDRWIDHLVQEMTGENNGN